MNRDPYVTALNNALTEIQKAYPDITHSFIFTNDGETIAGNAETDEKILNKVSESFENLKEKAQTMGKLTNCTINGTNGKLHVSNVNDLYFMLATNSNADDAQIYSLTHVVIPPLLKTLQTFAGQPKTQTNLQPNVPAKLQENSQSNRQTNVSSHLQTQSTVALRVNPLSGFFDGDAVQIDEKTLNDWSDQVADGDDIIRVKVETSQGKFKICKVKKITVGNMQGKNLIRMPAKVCTSLELKSGDTVNVSPKT